MKPLLACAALTVSLLAPMRAQQAAAKPLSFDAASLKPAPEIEFPTEVGSDGRVVRTPPPASFFGPLQFRPGNVATPRAGVSARALVIEAYNLMPGQLSGEPSWINYTRFDLNAKAENADESQLRLMLQSLLAERFHMVAHHETRTMHVDFLYPAKKGVKFKPWKQGDPMPSVNPGTHEHALLDHGPTSVLVRMVVDSRPVVDRLGLDGTYLYFVRWNDMYPGVLRANAAKQLGLKLKSGTAPVDVLMIDHIDKPDAN
jgi:uncharacterized protein (TIGR03435 family)